LSTATINKMAALQPVAVGFPPEPLEIPPIIHEARYRSNEVLFLMRDGGEATSAYSRIDKPSIACSHERGSVLFCHLWSRQSSAVPFEISKEIMVVKKLLRTKLDKAIAAGTTQENSYTEIAYMQQCGDDTHIGTIHEALMDRKYLFIIMPWLGWDLSSTQIHDPKRLARAMMQDLIHLQRHAILHRDISPENIIFSSINSSTPLIDLAMTLKCCVLEGNSQNIAAGQPWCGKLPYISPEVLAQEEFDFAADVWSMGVTLLTLVLQERFWESPLPSDLMYTFFILDQGLTDHNVLERTIEALVSQNEFPPYLGKLLKVRDMDPLLRDLLGLILSPVPNDRPCVNEILNHPWFLNN